MVRRNRGPKICPKIRPKILFWIYVLRSVLRSVHRFWICVMVREPLRRLPIWLLFDFSVDFRLTSVLTSVWLQCLLPFDFSVYFRLTSVLTSVWLTIRLRFHWIVSLGLFHLWVVMSVSRVCVASVLCVCAVACNFFSLQKVFFCRSVSLGMVKRHQRYRPSR